ncbi:hypothetical protein V8F20_006027 [Naviculisporaceae sp. PSN 640]
MSVIQNSKHLDLEPRCGACGDLIFPGEEVVALYGNASPTSHGYISHTRSFPYPSCDSSDSTIVIDDKEICTRPGGCDPNRVAGVRHLETVTVHQECFRIYIHDAAPRLGKYRLIGPESRLYTAGLFRSPWPRAPPLSLTGASEMSYAVLSQVASRCGLSQLAECPAELVEMIHQYSPHSPFWRAISALTLAERVGTTVPEPLVVPFHEIDSWERGGKLTRWQPPRNLQSSSTSSRSRPPVVRLTIDAEGIRRIELLWGEPRYTSQRTDRLAFVVEELATFKGIDAHFEDGLVQLYSKSGYPRLRIWDTPTPPDLSLCTKLLGSEDLQPFRWRRWRTVELDSITGLTFFYRHRVLIGIHPHRADDIDTSASDTYQRLRLNQGQEKEDVVWIYHPMSSSDTINIFGSRSGDTFLVTPTILIRSRLSGDVIIGPMVPGAVREDVLGPENQNPTTLIYVEPTGPYPVPYLGTYRRTTTASITNSYTTLTISSQPQPRSPPTTQRDFPPDNNLYARGPLPRVLAYYSAAPLEGIISAQVFYSPRSPPATSNYSKYINSYPCPIWGPYGYKYRSFEKFQTKGILLRYQNGSSRALGEVRPHSERDVANNNYIPSITVKNPTHMDYLACFDTKENRNLAWIQFFSIKEEEVEKCVVNDFDLRGKPVNERKFDPACGDDAGDHSVLPLPLWSLKEGRELRFQFSEDEQHIYMVRHEDWIDMSSGVRV